MSAFKEEIMRPNRQSPEVIKAVVEKLYPKCKAWIKAGNVDDDEESTKEELADALRRCWFWDGYELAKYLDDWSPDASLVDILDNADRYCATPLKGLEREYAKTLKPLFRVGDRVTLPRESVCGEITSLDDTGHYHIYSEILGHVKEGSGVHAVIYRWEDIDEA